MGGAGGGDTACRSGQSAWTHGTMEHACRSGQSAWTHGTMEHACRSGQSAWTHGTMEHTRHSAPVQVGPVDGQQVLSHQHVLGLVSPGLHRPKHHKEDERKAEQ